MNLTSPSQVKDWCIGNGFHPNKVLGQNFLIDRSVVQNIAWECCEDEDSAILENILRDGIWTRYHESRSAQEHKEKKKEGTPE